MTYAALLFDMDGVVVDTHASVTAFWCRLAARHQVRLTEADFDRHIYGCPSPHTLEVLFPRLTQAERRTVAVELEQYETHQAYREVSGVTALLRALQAEAIPAALVTGGEPWKVEAVMQQLGLEGLFAARVTARDTRRGKPDPECYLLAARRLGKRPEQCLVFEDAVNGVQAAVASGSLCIGVRPQALAGPLWAAGVRHVIADFSDSGLETGPGSGSRLRLDAAYSVPLAVRR